MKVMNKPLIKTFAIFKNFPNLVHGFSTRLGGISRPPFDSLNLGLSTADSPQAVRENRRLFFQALGISQKQVVFPQQIHSANIQIVSQAGTVADCDALITDRPGVYLSIQTADCFPVFLYAPRHKAVAIIHSGWRGTARNIAGKTVEMLKAHFGVQPQHLFAAIGPGVQKNCYQVDRSVISFFSPEFYVPDGSDRFLLDLQGAIRRQLQREGIPDDHIECDTDCTHCRTDLYYSYRRDGQQSGRMMGIIGLKP